MTKKFLLIAVLICAASHLAAQSDSIRLHADTFKLQDQTTTADLDGLLLDLVAAQSAQLHANDTVIIRNSTSGGLHYAVVRERSET